MPPSFLNTIFIVIAITIITTTIVSSTTPPPTGVACQTLVSAGAFVKIDLKGVALFAFSFMSAFVLSSAKLLPDRVDAK